MKYNITLSEQVYNIIEDATLNRNISLLLEKKISVGKNLEQVLSQINSDLSNEILDFLKSDKIKDESTVDEVDFTPQDNMTITLRKKKEHGTELANVKLVKALRYLGYDIMSFIANLPREKKYQLSEILTALKTDVQRGVGVKNKVFGSSKTPYDLKIVRGDKILWAYLCDNYDLENPDLDESGNLPKSCMRFEKSQKYVRFYTMFPDVISMALLTNKNNGKVMGRALIWKTNKGQYMDRIFTINKGLEPLFNKVSIGMLSYQKKDYKQPLLVKDVVVKNNMPDMDTFKVDEYEGKLVLATDAFFLQAI